jgi:hypothetical protein
MSPLQDAQHPILERIATALIDAIPEHWTFAQLRLIAPAKGIGTYPESASHSITNPTHPHEFLAPTEELSTATWDLEQICRSHRSYWKRVVITVRLVDGDWDWAAKFEY